MIVIIVVIVVIVIIVIIVMIIVIIVIVIVIRSNSNGVRLDGPQKGARSGKRDFEVRLCHVFGGDKSGIGSDALVYRLSSKGAQIADRILISVRGCILGAGGYVVVCGWICHGVQVCTWRHLAVFMGSWWHTGRC